MLPSSSPIAINGERSSTSLPAQGFSTTASAAALRVGGVTGRPSSLHVSSTMVRNFRMFEALMLGSPLFIPLYLYCSPRDVAGPCGRRRHGADHTAPHPLDPKYHRTRFNHSPAARKVGRPTAYCPLFVDRIMRLVHPFVSSHSCSLLLTFHPH